MTLRPRICIILAAYLVVLSIAGCTKEKDMEKQLSYNFIEKQIKVNGDVSDWEGIEQNIVQGADQLWLGQGMTLEKWKGNDDHSFKWKGAWHGNKLYFLVEVTDDNPQPCDKEFSWINDVVEILIDPQNLEGERIEGVGEDTPIEERLGKKQRGYEMHFLPSSPPKVYLEDSKAIYRLESFQNDMFSKKWAGEIVTKRTSNGYLIEIGLSVPGINLKPDMIMGLEVGVGDDDGNERKSLMTWTGRQVPFWINMDNYGKIKLVK